MIISLIHLIRVCDEKVLSFRFKDSFVYQTNQDNTIIFTVDVFKKRRTILQLSQRMQFGLLEIMDTFDRGLTEVIRA